MKGRKIEDYIALCTAEIKTAHGRGEIADTKQFGSCFSKFLDSDLEKEIGCTYQEMLFWAMLNLVYSDQATTDAVEMILEHEQDLSKPEAIETFARTYISERVLYQVWEVEHELILRD